MNNKTLRNNKTKINVDSLVEKTAGAHINEQNCFLDSVASIVEHNGIDPSKFCTFAEYIDDLNKYRLEMECHVDVGCVWTMHAKGDQANTVVKSMTLSSRLYFFDFIDNGINYYTDLIKKDTKQEPQEEE